MISLLCSNFSQIGPLTVELAVLERLKSSNRFIMALRWATCFIGVNKGADQLRGN